MGRKKTINYDNLIPGIWRPLYVENREGIVWLGKANLTAMRCHYECELASAEKGLKAFRRMAKRYPGEFDDTIKLSQERVARLRSNIKLLDELIDEAEDIHPVFALHRPDDHFRVGDEVYVFCTADEADSLKDFGYLRGKILEVGLPDELEEGEEAEEDNPWFGEHTMLIQVKDGKKKFEVRKHCLSVEVLAVDDARHLLIDYDYALLYYTSCADTLEEVAIGIRALTECKRFFRDIKEIFTEPQAFELTHEEA